MKNTKDYCVTWSVTQMMKYALKAANAALKEKGASFAMACDRKFTVDAFIEYLENTDIKGKDVAALLVDWAMSPTNHEYEKAKIRAAEKRAKKDALNAEISDLSAMLAE